MRPVPDADADRTDRPAESVCCNRFRSDDAEGNAGGPPHEKLRRCGSLIIGAADRITGRRPVRRRPWIGKALPTRAPETHPPVAVRDGRRSRARRRPADPSSLRPVRRLPSRRRRFARPAARESPAFFDAGAPDAVAPIGRRESVDMSKARFRSRHDEPERRDARLA